MKDGITLRPANRADLVEINAIYNYYIAHSTCVWATQPCSEAERKAWYREHGQSMPVLIAEQNGRVVGWGALGSFRAAYTASGTLEDSIYATTPRPFAQRRCFRQDLRKCCSLLFESANSSKSNSHVFHSQRKP